MASGPTAGHIFGSPETAVKALLGAPSVVVAGDHSVQHASLSALKLVGRSAAAVQTLLTFEACFESAVAEPAASCMIGRRGTQAEAREAELTARAGQPIWCIAVHVPLPWCGGELGGLALLFLLRAGTLPPSRRSSWAAASMPSMLSQFAADVDAATLVGLLLEPGSPGWFVGGRPSVGLAAASGGAEEIGTPAALLARPLCTWAARVAKAGVGHVTRLPWGGGEGGVASGGGDGGDSTSDCDAVVAFWPIPCGDKTCGPSDASTGRVLACAVPLCGLEPLLGDYVLGEIVGTGGLGTVFLSTHWTTRDRVAVKMAATAELSPLELAAMTHEAGILAAIDHPNVVRLHQVLRGSDHISLVLEIAPGQTLRSLLSHGSTLTLADVWLVAFQLLHVLSWLHTEAGLCHGDVKLENLLYHPLSGWVTLVDFGFANRVDTVTGLPAGESPWAAAGTRLYVPPEAVDPEASGPAGHNGPKSDAWAAGVVLLQILGGACIEALPTIHECHGRVTEALAALSSARAPANWIALLSQLLDAAPESRLSPAQAANELLSCEAADPARASGLRAPVQRLSAQYAGTRPTPSFASVRFRHHPLSLSGSRPLLGSDESRTLSLDT